MATIEQALQETGHAFTQQGNTTVEVRTVRLSQDWKTYGQPIVDLVILADGQGPTGLTGTLAEVWQHLRGWAEMQDDFSPDALEWEAAQPRGAVPFTLG